MENLFRDYVLTWYKKVAADEEGFKAIVMLAQVINLSIILDLLDHSVFTRDEAWVAVEKIAHRLRAVDMVLLQWLLVIDFM